MGDSYSLVSVWPPPVPLPEGPVVSKYVQDFQELVGEV